MDTKRLQIVTLVAVLVIRVASAVDVPADTAVCISEMPGQMIITNSTGSLRWPAEGETYPTDRRCYWRIAAPSGKIIRYKFLMFDVHSSDYLELFQSGNLAASSQYPDYAYQYTHAIYNEGKGFPNEELGATTVTYLNRLHIVLDTDDDANVGKGFHIEWEVIDQTECFYTTVDHGEDKMIINSTDTYTLDYPSNHDKYGPYHSCLWIIQPPPGKAIKYRFVDLNMFGSSAVYSYSPLGAVVSMYDDPSILDDRTEFLATDFLGVFSYSSDGYNDDGWIISWEFVDADCVPCFQTNGECVDRNKDGKNDTCICPPGKCSVNLTLGCDRDCVYGGWSSWTDWSSCSVTCGDGIETRERLCNNPTPVGDSSYDCPGEDLETRPCEKDECPVQGGWSSWGSWSSCPLLCGGNGDDFETRNRTCDRPPPVGGPEYDCEGDDSEERVCGNGTCPVQGGWGTWSSWTTCPITCGGNGEDSQTRNRSCDSPVPVGGPDYYCEGVDFEGRPCGETRCPVEGGWGTWSSWTTCPVTCGGIGEDFETRNRTCDNPLPFGGPDYDCEGNSTQERVCGESKCPVPGGWGDWSSWSTCPVTCGSGLQIRSRSCDNPPPVGGPSYDCKGASSSTQSCWEYECPGDWTTWGSWSSCSTTCGEGIRVRHRQCSNGTCIGEFRDTKPCVLQACSDDEGCVVPLPGDFCEDDSQCKRLSDRMYCDNVCTCIYGYYPENANCIRIKLGSPCSDEDFCRRGVKNSICDQSKCACPSFMVHIGSGESSACVHPFSPLSYPACQICANTEGVCYDSDQDATPDSCDCSPLRFRPSDPSNQLATGCDQCYAYPGEYCRADGAVICTDPNSECVHDGPLHGGFICQCRTGFVSVPGKADSKKRICARHIPPALDEECQVCVSNAGKCYDVDGDNKMDGCLCPLTRTSTCDLASHACDKQHVTVNCTSSDMTICIHDKDDFVGELSGMFVEGYGDILACHFKPVDEITWCLTLDYDNKDLCGLNVLDTKDTTSYYIWITLEHHSGIMSYLDVCLYGYCTYYKKACTHTGLLDVTTKKLTASEGESVRPGATMNIYNKFGKNLELVGASLGDSVKLVVEIVDDKNIYVALRAEVCVVSNMLSLSHPHVESAVFILNGCPVDESESGIRPPVVFMPDKKNLLKIMTNNFGIPKFSTDMVFFQCCVKVCIDAKKCAPRTCPTGRRKRALSRQSGSSLLKEYAESPDTITSVVGVFVHQRTDSKNSFISPANDASRKAMETVDSTGNSEDDPKDVSKSVILACTAVGVVTVIGVVAHVYLKRRRESL